VTKLLFATLGACFAGISGEPLPLNLTIINLGIAVCIGMLVGKVVEGNL
jgi:hypothetical protein